MKNKKRKERRRATGATSRQVLGVAWYRPEQWAKLLEASQDREQLEESHQEWLVLAEKAITDFKNQGVTLRKVDVDVDELVAWCMSQGIPVDGAARASFVARLLRNKDERKQE